MPTYFLKSARLGFRKWTYQDLETATGLWGDHEVTKLIGGKFSDEQIKERLNTEIKRDKEFGVQYWPIFFLETDENVGCCGLRPYDVKNAVYEIGFHIRSNHWKNGFASEASKAVIDYAFNKLKVSALFAGHNPKNEASKHLLEKLGFKYTHDEFYAPTGLNHPSYLLTRST